MDSELRGSNSGIGESTSMIGNVSFGSSSDHDDDDDDDDVRSSAICDDFDFVSTAAVIDVELLVAEVEEVVAELDDVCKGNDDAKAAARSVIAIF